MNELNNVIENMKVEVKEILLEYVNQEELNFYISDEIVSGVLADCLSRKEIPSYTNRNEVIYSLHQVYQFEMNPVVRPRAKFKRVTRSESKVLGNS